MATALLACTAQLSATSCGVSDDNIFSGNEAGDLGGDGNEEAVPVDGQPAQAPAVASKTVAPVDADLLRELECIVCKDVMLRPFSVCHLGHASACMPCYKLLKACPACRGKLLSPPTRLLPLEGVAKNALVPCPNTADGCPLDALRYADAGAHADTCDWRKVTCALAQCALPFCLVCRLGVINRERPLQEATTVTVVYYFVFTCLKF